MPRDLILGCGFLGIRLAENLLKRNADGSLESEIHTITRSPSKAEKLRQLGLQVRVADLTTAAAKPLLLQHTPFRSITVCVANDSSKQSHSEVYTAATQLAIDLANRSIEAGDRISSTRIHFVSTTGVYADPDSEATGMEVDETWPVAPKRPGSVASLACEKRLQQDRPSSHCVFRLAGIYDRSRIPNLANLRAGEPLSGSGDGWLNLIHVADAAEILARAIMDPPLQTILNVADGQPILRRDFYRQISEHLGCPEPVFDESATGRGGRKRIAIGRLLHWHPFQFRQVSSPSVWIEA